MVPEGLMPEEISDPNHLLPESPESPGYPEYLDLAVVVAKAAVDVCKYGFSIEEALAGAWKEETGESIPEKEFDDPNARGLVVGHLIIAALGGEHYPKDKVFPDPDGPEDPEASAAEPPAAPKKVLTADQRTELFNTLHGRFTSELDRYAKDIEWAAIKKSLEAATPQVLYALFKMEENGHEVGVKREERDGVQGFRFDSCSEESPAGIRSINHFRAEEIAGGWSAPLMPQEVFEELRIAEIILNRTTWDHLKTDNLGTSENPDLSWYGNYVGTYKNTAYACIYHGGFRCSLWIPEA